MDHRGSHTSTKALTDTNQLLIVECGLMRVAIPGRAIRGLFKTVEIAFRDTITLLDETYEKEDLVTRLDPDKAVVPFSSQGRTVLCSNGVSRKAYLVDRILALVRVGPSHVSPLPLHFRGVEREWFVGLFFFQEAPVLIINLDWVLKPIDVACCGSNCDVNRVPDTLGSGAGG